MTTEEYFKKIPTYCTFDHTSDRCWSLESKLFDSSNCNTCECNTDYKMVRNACYDNYLEMIKILNGIENKFLSTEALQEFIKYNFIRRFDIVNELFFSYSNTLEFNKNFKELCVDMYGKQINLNDMIVYFNNKNNLLTKIKVEYINFDEDEKEFYIKFENDEMISVKFCVKVEGVL